MIRQHLIVVPARCRGYHLITSLVLRAVGQLPEAGLLHLFIQHTSAALTVNENADPSVRADFESAMNRIRARGGIVLHPHARRRRRHAGAYQVFVVGAFHHIARS